MADHMRDVIDVAPRFTAAQAADLDARFAGQPAAQMLAALIGDRLVGRVALVSSFGAEAAVLLHMVASIDASVPVIFLDTGKHFPETLAYRDALAATLGLTDLRSLTPDPADLAARDAGGERWSYDPDGCCELRKVRPLARALAGFDATISGRKGFQASTRAALPLVEIDLSDAAGRLKINPLRDWVKADLDAYFEAHTLPRHPLEAEGYPSIGCAPCTSAVAEGEDARAGRWRGFAKVECGIHLGGVGG
ncbi:MAG: phosphoadenylyl-sulfate reductase [Sphingomonas sp.]|nr:phosphoadenylyl-sulfate reductase [Sphingomonas sp.]